MQQHYQPDFESECSVCGQSPTVTVIGHVCPDTLLCSWHFFAQREKLDWENWNEPGEQA